MGKKINTTTFFSAKTMQKNGKSIKDTAEALGISEDSVRKIRSVGTWQAYLRRWVYPKRKNGKSYEQAHLEDFENFSRRLVNGREKELEKAKLERYKAEAALLKALHRGERMAQIRDALVIIALITMVVATTATIALAIRWMINGNF